MCNIGKWGPIWPIKSDQIRCARARIHLKFHQFQTNHGISQNIYGIYIVERARATPYSVRIKLAPLRPFLSLFAHTSHSHSCPSSHSSSPKSTKFLPTMYYAKVYYCFGCTISGTAKRKQTQKRAERWKKKSISQSDRPQSDNAHSIEFHKVDEFLAFWWADTFVFFFFFSLFRCVQSPAIDDDDDDDAWRWVTASDNIVNGFLHELMWSACTETKKENSFRNYYYFIIAFRWLKWKCEQKIRAEWARNDYFESNCSINMPFSHDHLTMTNKTKEDREKNITAANKSPNSIVIVIRPRTRHEWTSI